MTSILLSSFVIFNIIVPSKSEWNCDQETRKCVCAAGKCNMFGQPDYTAYICAKSAQSCTVHCYNAYSCNKANFYMMPTENAEIICNGRDSCSNSNIYCGESSMGSCHITIHNEAMNNGFIKCDDHISECTVDIISNISNTIFECMSAICLCPGKDCNNKRNLLASNSSKTTTITPYHSSQEFFLPDFSIIEYVVIAISLVFCCGTFAIFIVICYCQRLKYKAIKRYREAQCMQQRERDSNNSYEASDNNTNHSNNSYESRDISLEIHDKQQETESKTNTSIAVFGSQSLPKYQSQAPIFMGDDSDLPQLMPPASYPAHNMQFDTTQSPFNAGIDCIDQNGIRHHIYYLSHSSYQNIFPATFHPNHVQYSLNAPSLPYSPTTTYHHQGQSQSSTIPDGIAQYRHTLQIPKLQRKSSSHKSLSTLTSITSTLMNSGMTLSSLGPSSFTSDEASPVSSNGSIYICRFDDVSTLGKRPSIKDQKTDSRDFTLQTIKDELLLGDETPNTVHAVLPHMMDKELSLSETPEPHNINAIDANNKYIMK